LALVSRRISLEDVQTVYSSKVDGRDVETGECLFCFDFH